MKIIKLKINTKNHKYPIIIGSGLITKIPKLLNSNSIKQLKDDISKFSNTIVGYHGKKILSKTISISTVESEIAKSLEDIQNKFKNIEIGSYPFFRLGKVGVSIVMRSTEKNQIDDCSKKIISFVQKKKIQIIKRG